MADSTLVLIDLNSQASFEFQFFPNDIRDNDGANWEEQDTTAGKKPLFYANRRPRTWSFPELYFDTTDTSESLTESIEELRAFCLDEVPDQGSPPAMLATWGDQKLRCVVTDMTFDYLSWTDEGNPTRARLALELKELQEEGGTGVAIGK